MLTKCYINEICLFSFVLESVVVVTSLKLWKYL